MMPEVKDLTEGEYELFRRLVYEKSGINLGDKKMQLVQLSRLFSVLTMLQKVSLCIHAHGTLLSLTPC